MLLLALYQLVDTFDVIERIIDMKHQLRYDSQLVANLLTEVSPYLDRAIDNVLEHSFLIAHGKNAEVDFRETEIG